VHEKQVRDQAWMWRTFAAVEFVTPDAHPLKQYFRKVVETNMAHYLSIYPAANGLGIVSGGSAFVYSDGGPSTGFAPWQDNFFTYGIGRLVEVGFEAARPLLEFKARWPLNTLNGDYCYVFAANYSLIGRDSASAPIYANHQDLYAKNFPESLRSLGCGSAAWRLSWA
jgi:hypothetical protein